MAIKSEYGSREVEAAQRVLIDLMQILGEYGDGMVLIGGWAPYYHFGKEHTGSMDIDIALIKTRSPLKFMTPYANISKNGDTDKVTSKKHRYQEIQPDLKARKARGSELALQYCTKMSIKGTMPNGSADTVESQVSNVLPFIVMKGMAMHDRHKEKDAWEIYFCIKHFKGGPKEVSSNSRKLSLTGL
jgi:hypothetical protein